MPGEINRLFILFQGLVKLSVFDDVFYECFQSLVFDRQNYRNRWTVEHFPFNPFNFFQNVTISVNFAKSKLFFAKLIKADVKFFST